MISSAPIYLSTKDKRIKTYETCSTRNGAGASLLAYHESRSGACNGPGFPARKERITRSKEQETCR